LFKNYVKLTLYNAADYNRLDGRHGVPLKVAYISDWVLGLTREKY